MSGVPITIPSLPTVTMTSGDSIPVWDTESGLQGRVTVAQLQTFLSGIYLQLTGGSLTGALVMAAFDAGTGAGPVVRVQRNTNASTPSPGFINFQRPDNGNGSIYVTDDGMLRIGTSFNVTPGNMATGVVVGTQSSNLQEKEVIGNAEALEVVIERVEAGAQAVRQFRYKPSISYDEEGNAIEGARPFGGEKFSGVIVDYAPEYGMDRSAEFPAGRALNDINILGDLLRAVAWLVEQNAALTARVAALEGA